MNTFFHRKLPIPMHIQNEEDGISSARLFKNTSKLPVASRKHTSEPPYDFPFLCLEMYFKLFSLGTY